MLSLVLGVVLVGALTMLGVFGHEVARQAPSSRERVVTESGGEKMKTNAPQEDASQADEDLAASSITAREPRITPAMKGPSNQVFQDRVASARPGNRRS